MTKPGGVVNAAVWDYADGMEMLRVFWGEAIALDPPSAARDEKNMPLCKRGELAAFFRESALRDVEESALVITIGFASFDDYWQPFLLGQGPAGAYVAHLPEAKRNALAARLRARLGHGAVELRARAWAAKGRRAADHEPITERTFASHRRLLANVTRSFAEAVPDERELFRIASRSRSAEMMLVSSTSSGSSCMRA